MTHCEHEDRIARAVFAIEQMGGAGVIDLPKLIAILKGKQ